MAPLTIASFSADDITPNLQQLAALLHACVHDGASIGYILPFTFADSEAFWIERVRPGLHNGTRVLLAATRDEAIVGSVQLDFDTPPNQPHRAEVRKLLVHPAFRRQGIARRLMAEVEQRAEGVIRNLLRLDSRSCGSGEERYTSRG